MRKINIQRTEEILSNLSNATIVVIGDVMLDRFFWGSVSRVSPEAPVPVVDLEKETFHLGGAANVAGNLRSLGAKCVLCGVIGDDNSGVMFKNIAADMGVDCSGLFVDSKRPTTVKTRIIGNNQHITRLDREVKTEIDRDCEDYIFNSVFSKNPRAIVFADYDKGVITANLIHRISMQAIESNIPIFVDPKFKYFFEYQNTFLFKPNKKEAGQSLGRNLKSNEDVINAGKELKERLNCQNLLLTLGSDGMMLFSKDNEIFTVPTIARNIADVSGAGDTAIATLSAAIAGNADIYEAALLANFAAGAVCEEPGTVQITRERLLKAIEYSRM